MKKASWILLTLLTGLFLLASVASLTIAYFADPTSDIIVQGTTLADLSLEPEVATALRGRRGTAAALGLAFGVLLMMIILGPYRAGDRWAWFAIFVGLLVFALATLLRVPLLGTWLGASTALLLFVLVMIALLLDIKRLSEPRL